MYEIDTKLEELEKAGKPIRVALIGAGQMGKDIVSQISEMKGMRCDIIVSHNTTANARDSLVQAKYEGEIVETNDPEIADAAIARGAVVVSTDYKVAVKSRLITNLIDCTGSPETGARITMDCIRYKKHIVMMNVECDITVGPILRKLCEQAGIVYSLTAGDEPGSIIEVYRFAKALGFEVVAAGKGKNNPLDFYATPDQEPWASRAKARKMNPRMLVEFVDGSKTMIEMCAVANATGLSIDKRGMHGPNVNVKDLNKVFALKKDGGILDHSGVVEYAIGDVAPGVFVIVTTKNQRIIDGLVQRDMGNGPNYLLYRPYHLCSIETPITAAQAAIYGESTGHPMDHLTCECITLAKKDLKAGEVLDGIGEFCYRASIEKAEIAREGNMLPVGLAKGAKMLVDVKKDEIITYDMVQLREDSVLLQLRRLQDQMFTA